MRQEHRVDGPRWQTFWAGVPPRTSRRGNFWVPGERVSIEGRTYQRGPMSEPFAYEEGEHVYYLPTAGAAHSQWPFDPPDDAAQDQFLATFGPLPADLAASQDMDADRLARLLDRVGPAIVITHSASGPDGWLVADRRPGLVVAIVAVEANSDQALAVTLEWLATHAGAAPRAVSVGQGT